MLTPSVRAAACFLIKARNDEENTWGPYKGLSLDLPSSAAAIEALESCEQEDFKAVILNSRLVLTGHIRSHAADFGLGDLTASLRILARSPRSDDLDALTSSLIEKIVGLRRGRGWGFPAPTIPATVDVLSAVVSHNDAATPLVSDIVRAVFDEQNEDGGWPVVMGGTESSVLPSARALFALVALQPGQESADFQKGCQYLRRVVESGWGDVITGGGGVQLAADVLRAAASLKSFPFEELLRGIEAVLDQRNNDGAWGERKGGLSNVEATSSCIAALCATGGNRLITSRLALWAIDDATAALNKAEKELKQTRDDIRARVSKETKVILADNVHLSAKVGELEKEKKILVERATQRERALERLSQARVYANELDSGSKLLQSSLNFRERMLFWFTASPVNVFASLTLVLAGIFLAGAAVLAPEILKWEIPLTWVKIFGYGAAALGAAGAVFGLLSSVYFRNNQVFSLGRSESRIILRELPSQMGDWPSSRREIFLHQLDRLQDLTPDLQEAVSRSMSREFGMNPQQVQQLRVLLSLLTHLDADQQKRILYELRKIPTPAGMP
jgi:hypothetical protein